MTAPARRRPRQEATMLALPSEAALVAAFNAALAAAGESAIVASLTIDRLRLTPGQKIVAGVTACCLRGDERFSQLFGVRFFPPGVSPARMAKAKAAAIVPSKIGPGVLHLDTVGAVAWAFPNDRKILGAHVLSSVERFSKVVFTKLRAAGDVSAACVKGVTVLRYVPEHGCTARIDLDGPPFTLIAKISSDDRGEAGLAAMRAIRRGDDRLCPAPVAALPQFNLAIQSFAPGAPLPAEDYLDPRTGAAGRAMALLALLHQTPPPARLPRLDTRAAVATTAERLSAFADRDAVAALRLLRAHEPPAPPLQESLLHGDLHFGNILVDQTRGVLIDFDAAMAGPPEHDLGGFLAAMLWRGAIAGMSSTALLAALAGAVDAYRNVERAPLNLPFLSWRIGEALISERLVRALTRMKPDRKHALAPLLDWSEHALRGDIARSLS